MIAYRFEIFEKSFIGAVLAPEARREVPESLARRKGHPAQRTRRLGAEIDGLPWIDSQRRNLTHFLAT